ncbi:alpha/beta-hydrolase [Xylariaceae sp. AK1471]|nr:alpha/beta-hydrolase [Xylariaceae sp. AK1471]
MEFPPVQHLKLGEQRNLAYAIFGDPNAAKTVFYHHGFPSSRNEAVGFDDAARKHGIRLISVDRPGHGHSTPQPNRRILDWPADLSTLAEHLNADAFAVLGISGGAPYALACAHDLPRTRCVGVGIACGLYPAKLGLSGMLLTTRVILAIAQWSTWIVAKMMESSIGKDPENVKLMFEDMLKKRPQADYEAWKNHSELRRGLVSGLVGAFEANGQGGAWESYLNGHDWGFNLEDIKVAPGEIVMWHGAKDVNVPVQMAEKAARLIKNADLRVSENEAHLSLVVEKIDEIMRTMSDMLPRR